MCQFFSLTSSHLFTLFSFFSDIVCIFYLFIGTIKNISKFKKKCIVIKTAEKLHICYAQYFVSNFLLVYILFWSAELLLIISIFLVFILLFL